MNKDIFTLSEHGSKEYSASIVRIGELHPIEGSDFLARTVVDGEDIVVRKDEVTPGDIMVYARIETVLDSNFLETNNLYEWSERSRNKNYPEVMKLVEEGKETEAKRKVGFFNKHGRVKIVKLRGCPSKGFLFTKDALVKWNPSLEEVNLEDYIDDVPYFDSINGEIFIKVYVPYVAPIRERSKDRRLKKREPKFDILIPGQFSFHYDTTALGKEIFRFSPDDKVSISVKLHGTSICIGNVLIKKLLNLSETAKLINKARQHNYSRLLKESKTSRSYNTRVKSSKAAEKIKSKIKKDWTIGYGVVYSSRKIVKNQYINRKVTGGFYGTDVWADYYKLLKNCIPEGYELFGEIVGYVSGSTTYIQKDYDYGCKPGENKLMIYRITVQEETKKRELDVPEVFKFTKDLVKNHPELKDRIHPIDILYNGTLKGLYPELNPELHWHEDLLEKLKNDFGLEQTEPMNNKKVPREGIVLRKDGDPIAEAFKLKANAFLFKEAEAIDKGEVDIEMSEGYGEEP